MKNILIVEDSATYRELLCKVLKGKGYKVKGVGSVKSALDEIKKDIYDFICTDYNLPDDTGTALLQHEFTKNIPICIMTTSVDRHIFNMAKSLGAVECFDKATPKKEKKTYTVEEIAEQLCVSKKVAYALVKSGQFAYVRAGRAIRVSKDSFDKWLNQN